MRDAALWRVSGGPRQTEASRAYTDAIQHVHLLFWGSEWQYEGAAREQMAVGFREALLGPLRANLPEDETRVTMSVVSTAAHTSPGDPPELLANSDVTALVANLMCKRAIAHWSEDGVALYCVVLGPSVQLVDGANRYAYTAYRQNMRDVHCGWLICQQEPKRVVECARRLLAEVESALCSDAV